jgi:hypothetical protein
MQRSRLRGRPDRQRFRPAPREPGDAHDQRTG